MAQRELMSNGCPGDEEHEEEEALLPNSSNKSRTLNKSGSGGLDKGKGSREGEGSRLPPGSYSYIALLVVVCVLTIIVWSLPEKSWLGKIDLMRQSWHLNKVLDEADQLRRQLEDSKKDAAELKKSLEREDKRAIDLQQRDVKADSDTRLFQVQLVDETAASSGLTGSNEALQARVDSERARRKELLRKLQELKRNQMPLLQAISDAEDGAEKAYVASGGSPPSASSSGSSASMTSSIGVLPGGGAVSLPSGGGFSGRFGGSDASSDGSPADSLAALAAPTQIRAAPKVSRVVSSSASGGASASSASTAASGGSSSSGQAGENSWASAAESELDSLKLRLQREVAADRKVADAAAVRSSSSGVTGSGFTSSGVRPSDALPPAFSRIGLASGG